MWRRLTEKNASHFLWHESSPHLENLMILQKSPSYSTALPSSGWLMTLTRYILPQMVGFIPKYKYVHFILGCSLQQQQTKMVTSEQLIVIMKVMERATQQDLNTRFFFKVWRLVLPTKQDPDDVSQCSLQCGGSIERPGCDSINSERWLWCSHFPISSHFAFCLI